MKKIRAFRIRKTGTAQSWLAFRALNSDGLRKTLCLRLPAFTVAVEKGKRSAEGPITTKEAQTFASNFSPLKFSAAIAAGAITECSPFENFVIEFTTRSTETNFTKELIKSNGNRRRKYLSGGKLHFIQGVKKGRTTYKSRLTARQDIFGRRSDSGDGDNKSRRRAGELYSQAEYGRA